jgi:hypothetical protein
VQGSLFAMESVGSMNSQQRDIKRISYNIHGPCGELSGLDSVEHRLDTIIGVLASQSSCCRIVESLVVNRCVNNSIAECSNRVSP